MLAAFTHGQIGVGGFRVAAVGLPLVVLRLIGRAHPLRRSPGADPLGLSALPLTRCR